MTQLFNDLKILSLTFQKLLAMFNIKKSLTLIALLGALVGLNSCQKDNNTFSNTADTAEISSQLTNDLADAGGPIDAYTKNTAAKLGNDGPGSNESGAVFVMTNSTTDNKVLVFDRKTNGTIALVDSFATGGKGTGAGLGSQNALMRYGNYLLACNAGSNDITSFKISGTRLTKLDQIGSQGTMPISIAAYGGLVYVLNAGSTGNIAGFRWLSNGHFTVLNGSVRPLSTASAGGAQIQFTPSGKVLVVTEKATNSITTYAIDRNGITSTGVAHHSVGLTPFGFGITAKGQLIVSNAEGGAALQSSASSYNVSNNGDVTTISGAIGTKQTSACWVVITNDNRFCYTANAVSNTLTGYKISATGKLSLLDNNGVTAATDNGPLDMILSDNGKFLYTIHGRGRAITFYKVGNNGGLTSIGTFSGLTAGSAGIAAL